MRAVWISSNNVSVIGAQLPQVAPGEALIRVILAGICNTDIELIRGYYGFEGIPGHEFVGVVEVCEDSNLVGKRVVADINVPCENCMYCAAGLKKHCVNRRVLGINNFRGVFAEYFTFPLKNLVVIPDSLPDNVAVWAEPYAAACDVLNHFEVTDEIRVAVLGDGKLASLTAIALQNNTDLTLVGKHPHRVERLRALGINSVVSSELQETGFDVVVEATGSSSGVSSAIRLVRPRGTIVAKSTLHEEVPINLSALVVNEVKLVGSRCGDIRATLSILHEKAATLNALVDGVYSLKDAATALEVATKADAFKVFIRP